MMKFVCSLYQLNDKLNIHHRHLNMKLLPFLLNFCLLGGALRTAVRRPGGRGQSGVIPDHAINNDSCDETDLL